MVSARTYKLGKELATASAEVYGGRFGVYEGGDASLRVEALSAIPVGRLVYRTDWSPEDNRDAYCRVATYAEGRRLADGKAEAFGVQFAMFHTKSGWLVVGLLDAVEGLWPAIYKTTALA